MDSLGLMQLVAFLEEEFDVEIDDADITADHFRTVGDIETLVTQKVQKSAEARRAPTGHRMGHA